MVSLKSKYFSFEYNRNLYVRVILIFFGIGTTLIGDAFVFRFIDYFIYDGDKFKYNSSDYNLTEFIIGIVFFILGICFLIYRKNIERFCEEKYTKDLFVIKHQALGEVSNIDFNKRISGRNYKRYNKDIITINEIEFDRNDDYESAIENQEELTSKYSERISQANEVAYFGLSRIPLSFLLGSRIGNNSNITVFDFDRTKKSWTQISYHFFKNLFPNKSKLEILNERTIDESGKDLILSISVSYLVSIDDAISVVANPYKVVDMRINNFEKGKYDRLKSKREIVKLKTDFKKYLDTVSDNSNIDTIHLFYSGPNSLAFVFGSMYSNSMHKNIIVYNYNNNDIPKYSWSISINDLKLIRN